MAAKKPKSPAKSTKELPNVKRRKFLAAYSVCGNVSDAAKAARVHRTQHYAWLEDAEYAREFASVHEQACDALEMEARRRAIDGIEEPIVYQGNFTYEPLRNKDGSVKRDKEGNTRFSKNPLTVRKKSDVLLIFLLKGARPDKYRDNFKGTVTTGALPMSLDLAQLTDDELEQLRSLAAKASQSSPAGSGSQPAGPAEDAEVLPG